MAIECHCLRIFLLHKGSIGFFSLLISPLRGRHFLLLLPFCILAGRRWCPSMNVVYVVDPSNSLTFIMRAFSAWAALNMTVLFARKWQSGPSMPGFSQSWTAPSESGDCSCQESEAPCIEVTEPPAAVDEELLVILLEAVKDLGLDRSLASKEHDGHVVSAAGSPCYCLPETRSIFPRGPWGNLVGLVLPLFGPSLSRVN